nr:MAG TPA: hypothetical protein [Caudoviricetes sp.]
MLRKMWRITHILLHSTMLMTSKKLKQITNGHGGT